MNGVNGPDDGHKRCGCCNGAAVTTPVVLHNRAGLSSIAYRIGKYADFRASMIAGLSSSHSPQLGKLRTRESDDFTIALIDAFACAADVLTFYQERIANESYIGTATERISLQEMAKLIGYRLRPGVAAETQLAFALDAPPLAVLMSAAEPGAFVNAVPSILRLASGLKVQSVPGPDEMPQIFETVETIDARPEWNAIRPWMSEMRAVKAHDRVFWASGILSSLNEGDALVFATTRFTDGSSAGGAILRTVDSVTVHAESKSTRVTWQERLPSSLFSGEGIEVEVFAMRQKASVFGHNAPQWLVMSAAFRQQYAELAPVDLDKSEWPKFEISTGEVANAIDLDATYPGVKVGGFAVLSRFGPGAAAAGPTGVSATPSASGPAAVAVKAKTVGSNVDEDALFTDSASANAPRFRSKVFRIDRVTPLARADFSVSGKSTRLEVDGDLSEYTQFVRDTSVHVKSERIKSGATPVSGHIAGSALELSLTSAEALTGRILLVSGVRADNGRAIVQSVTVTGATVMMHGVIVEVTPPLAFPLLRDTVFAHANVAAATHGETGAQILGSGDASARFQRFEIKRLPLTYRSAKNERGVESELTVRVGNIEWTEKPTLFGSSPAERVYALETDAHGKNWIVFGDGVHGSRLPTGVNNIRATYRRGLGKGGNVRANQLTQLLAKPLGLKGVANPDVAAGGTDPEPSSQTKRSMPLGTRTLGRAVSLLDYEDFALGFTGVSKAQAEVLSLPAGPTIVITIAGQDGAPLGDSSPIWNNLYLALRAGGDPNVPFAILSYRLATFRLGLKVKYDPAQEAGTVLPAVETALRLHFSFELRSLGQPVRQSEVISVVHSVRGVMAVDVDLMRRNGGSRSVRFPARQSRLLSSRALVLAGIMQPAELLLLDPAPMAKLEVMP